MISIRIPPRTVQPLGPTPERLNAANDNFVVDPITQAYHFQDTPVQRLRAAGKLSPDQAEAATQFYADYYAAGLAPLGAQDYERPIVDGSPVLDTSDRRLGAADRYNKACTAMGRHFLPVVDKVVLRELSLEVVGRDIGYGNAPQARTGAMERLMGGLTVLALHYGLTTNRENK